MGESINNKILGFTNSLAGPLASQVSEASQVVQYSGLTVDKDNKIENNQSAWFSHIASLISKAMQILRHLNSAYELIELVSQLIDSICKKVKTVLAQISTTNTSLTEERAASEEHNETSTNHSEFIFYYSLFIFIFCFAISLFSIHLNNQAENESILINDSNTVIQNLREKAKTQTSSQAYVKNATESLTSIRREENEKKEANTHGVEECMDDVECHIINSLQAKVQQNVINPAFTATLNFALGPLERQIEEKFCKQFENLKKYALAYGEYDKRYTDNPKECGNDYNVIKDFLELELNSLGLPSPIQLMEVKDMDKGELTLVSNGEVRTFDMSNEKDRLLLAALVGGKVGYLNLFIKIT
jgi:hypothetical protein